MRFVIWYFESATIPRIPCPLQHPYSLHIFCYLTIITTLNSLFWPPSSTAHISFPPTLNHAQHFSFTNWSNISSVLSRLYTSYPLCLSDRKILWAHRSFIHSIYASGGDVRDLWLCTLLRYDKLCMKRKIWENGWEAGSSHQNSLPRLNSPSDSSFAPFSLALPLPYIAHTSPVVPPALMLGICQDFNSAVFWMLIPYLTSFRFVFSLHLPPHFPQASFSA